MIEGLRLFPAAVLAVVLPSLVRAVTRGPVTRLAAGLTAVSVLAAVILAAAADWVVVAAYGPAYATAVPAFRVLLIGFPLMSLNYVLTTQLVAWNGQRAFAALCALALVFNVIVNARIIPTLSILGAAWATVATETVLTIGCLAALAVRTSATRTAPGAALLES